MRTLLPVLLLGLAACTPEPEIHEGRKGLTDGGSFYLDWHGHPSSPEVAEEWRLHVVIYDPEDRETLIDDVDDVRVDAEMPDHGHGMPVKPDVTARDDGSFEAFPMQFQMPGYWEVTIGVVRGDVAEQAVFAVECCEGDDDHDDDHGHGHGGGGH